MSTTINAAPAAPDTASSEMSRPSVLRRIMRDRVAGAAATILTVVVVAALFAEWVAPYDPYAINLLNVMAPPGGDNLLGTDSNGRDILRRRRAAGRKRLLPKGVEIHFKRHTQQHA